MSDEAQAPSADKVEVESIFDLFATDEDAAEEGKWFKVGKIMEVKVRRFRAKKSLKVRETLEAPYKRAGQATAKIPEDAQEEIAHQHIARGIIADWKGVGDRDKKPVPYSPAAALRLLKALPEFATTVINISLSMDNYREEEKKEVEGNS